MIVALFFSRYAPAVFPPERSSPANEKKKRIRTKRDGEWREKRMEEKLDQRFLDREAIR